MLSMRTATEAAMRPQLLFTVIVAAALLAPAWLVSSHPAVGQGGFRALGITHDVLRGDGLFNQHYKMMGSLAGAVVSNATFVLLPHIQTRVAHMQGGWVDRPLEQLYDVAHLQRSMQRLHGVQVLTSLGAFADEASTCRGGQHLHACHSRPRPLGDDELGYYRHQIDLSIKDTWQVCTSARPDVAGRKGNITILLGARNAWEQWRWSRLPPSIPASLHRALRFSKRIRALAAEVVRGLGGRDAYNGVHLRVEGESGFWIRHCSSFIKDTTALYWPMYYQAAASLGLNNSVPLYVTVGAAELSSPMVSIFRERFASKVLNKADFLAPEKLEGLGVDQLAAIDYLVLRHAAKVVGFPFSSYSTYLQSARHLHGYHPTSSFRMADGAGLLWALGRVGNGMLLDNLYQCWSFFDTRLFRPPPPDVAAA